jgi:hypothetical protein
MIQPRMQVEILTSASLRSHYENQMLYFASTCKQIVSPENERFVKFIIFIVFFLI